MNKQGTPDTKPLTPTAETIITDLKARGGHHAVWYEVAGATCGSALRDALKRGVHITEDGGLRLGEVAKAKPAFVPESIEVTADMQEDEE